MGKKVVRVRKVAVQDDAGPQPSAEQDAAIEELMAMLEMGMPYLSLRGYAGTGKTFVAAALARRLLMKGKKVVGVAPTHKAAQVLRDRLENAGAGAIPCQTLPAFLGLKLRPDGRGGYALERDPEAQMPRGKIVVADESSMLGATLYEHIERATNAANDVPLQWVFVGDPAQLPPVNEPESVTLGFPGPVLDRVVRQAEDNPILTLATAIRKHDEDGGEPPAFRTEVSGKKGIGITHDADAFVASALRAFEDKKFKRDGSSARILAYRNRTVAHYNALVRRALRGDDAPRFVKGEFLVASDTWFVDDAPVITNSEEVRVREVDETSAAPPLDRNAREALAQVAPDATRPWAVWALDVKTDGRGGGSRYRELLVLHEREGVRMKRVLDDLKRAALSGHGRARPEQCWAAYYGLRDAFARVDYGYAQTVHKAQGSTYETAFVDLRDVRACRGEEATALLYVAVTRPSHRLALLV